MKQGLKRLAGMCHPSAFNAYLIETARYCVAKSLYRVLGLFWTFFDQCVFKNDHLLLVAITITLTYISRVRNTPGHSGFTKHRALSCNQNDLALEWMGGLHQVIIILLTVFKVNLLFITRHCSRQK